MHIIDHQSNYALFCNPPMIRRNMFLRVIRGEVMTFFLIRLYILIVHEKSGLVTAQCAVCELSTNPDLGLCPILRYNYLTIFVVKWLGHRSQHTGAHIKDRQHS